MPEADRRDAEMDALLRRSMRGPVPELTAGFEARVLLQVSQESGQVDRGGRWLLAGYGVASVAVSAGVMRGQGMGWAEIAVMMLGSLAVVAAVRWGVRRRPGAASVASWR